VLKSSLNKEIFKLALPNILSNISIPLISTVDTILMGQLSASHLAAVGTGAMIFNFIYWNFGFLRMGTTGITAQAYGQDNLKQISNTLGRALLTALGFAIFIFIFKNQLWSAGAYLMNIQPEYYTLAQNYFLIRISAIPAAMLLQALMGWLFGMQNSVFPLIITIFVNLMNVAFSIWMVKGLNMGVEGAAWGTVTSQFMGLFVAGLLIFVRYKKILFFKAKEIFIQTEFLKFLKINSDIFIRTVCLTFVFFFFYSQSAKLGGLVLASSVILLQFLSWMQFGVDGFSFAAESLAGKYFGAKNYKKLGQVIKLSFFHASGLAIAYSLVYWFFGENILRLFSNEEDVIQFTSKLLIFVAILPLASVAGYVWDGIFVGITAAKSMRNTMLFSVLIYIALYFVFDYFWQSASSIWISFILFMALRGVSQTYLFFRKKYALN